MSRAVTMYRRFHSQEPRKVGQFSRDMAIPGEIYCVGDAVNVLYRSDKLNPTTGDDEGWIDYIHDHERGVKVYLSPTWPGLSRFDTEAAGIARRVVPKWIRDQKELTWLGDCLGLAFEDADGKKHELKGTGTLPELYTVPSGKALLVIQGKRRVIAMIWGGRLGVEHRGIVH